MDRIESSGLDFFYKVREGYLTIAAQYDYMYVIPSAQSSDEIHVEIVNIIEHS